MPPFPQGYCAPLLHRRRLLVDRVVVSSQKEEKPRQIKGKKRASSRRRRENQKSTVGNIQVSKILQHVAKLQQDGMLLTVQDGNLKIVQGGKGLESHEGELEELPENAGVGKVPKSHVHPPILSQSEIGESDVEIQESQQHEDVQRDSLRVKRLEFEEGTLESIGARKGEGNVKKR